MSNDDRLKVCTHLRSKQRYGQVDPAHRAYSTSSLTEVFWCNHTMGSVGPDEVLCDSDTCCQGRWCFRSILEV